MLRLYPARSNRPRSSYLMLMFRSSCLASRAVIREFYYRNPTTLERLALQLGRGTWDADALRDIVREYAVELLCDDKAVLVIDETGFLKQGKASCGVARQYTGSAGKITNCQIGVFAAYASDKGHAFIDRALYLPKAWTSDSARMRAARPLCQ